MKDQSITWQQTTLKRDRQPGCCRIQTRNTSKWVAAHLCLRPCSLWDQPCGWQIFIKTSINIGCHCTAVILILQTWWPHKLVKQIQCQWQLMYNYDMLYNNGFWLIYAIINIHLKHSASIKCVCFMWQLMNHWISETSHWNLLEDMF